MVRAIWRKTFTTGRGLLFVSSAGLQYGRVRRFSLNGYSYTEWSSDGLCSLKFCPLRRFLCGGG